MNARAIAFEMLKEICLKESYSNLLLRTTLNKVEKKDRRLVTQIVYGTLQNYRYVRYQWEDLVHKKVKNDVAIVLDMSMYQLFCMDKQPSYAIVNEAVKIVKKLIHPRFSGIVNAILHKVIERGEREVVGSEIAKLSIETSHPDWLVAMWKAQYGMEVCEQICKSNLLIRKTCVRVNEMKTTKEALLATKEFETASFCESALIYTGTSLIESKYYQEGYVSIQDEASQMVAHIVDPQSNETILDVCSAPGTKACHMAEKMHNKGQLVCGDIHPHRVELIKQGASRLGLTCIDAKCMDATSLTEIADQMFDRVVCDVPCSGYGVLARKSDIKYHAKSTDMDTLIPLQQTILECASKHVKKGGYLIYSTCTLNKKENEKQVENFVKKHSEYQVLFQKTYFPFEADCDGFFITKLYKNG